MDGFLCNNCFGIFEEKTATHYEQSENATIGGTCKGTLFALSVIEQDFTQEAFSRLSAERHKLRQEIEQRRAERGAPILASITGQISPGGVFFGDIPARSLGEKANWISTVFRISPRLSRELVEVMARNSVSLGQANMTYHRLIAGQIEEEIALLQKALEKCERRLADGRRALQKIEAYRANQRFKVPHLSQNGCPTKHEYDYHSEQTRGIEDIWRRSRYSSRTEIPTTCRNCELKVGISGDLSEDTFPFHLKLGVPCGNSNTPLTPCDLANLLIGERGTEVLESDVKTFRGNAS